jgi:hypothetical protein
MWQVRQVKRMGCMHVLRTTPSIHTYRLSPGTSRCAASNHGGHNDSPCRGAGPVAHTNVSIPLHTTTA